MKSTTVGAKTVVEDVSPVIAAELAAPLPEGRKTYTNWKAFIDAGLTPSHIQCDGYRPVHMYNEGCHTTLAPNVKQMLGHFNGGHGGGFLVSFKENYRNGGDIVRFGKAWDGWRELEALGVELRDLTCDVCGKDLKITQRALIQHCKQHTGKSSRVKPGGDFWITLTNDVPLSDDEE
jgi:hypothetical protein